MLTTGTSFLLAMSFRRNWADEVEDFLILKEIHLSTLIDMFAKVPPSREMI